MCVDDHGRKAGGSKGLTLTGDRDQGSEAEDASEQEG
jgi:hypothetical protein